MLLFVRGEAVESKLFKLEDQSYNDTSPNGKMSVGG